MIWETATALIIGEGVILATCCYGLFGLYPYVANSTSALNRFGLVATAFGLSIIALVCLVGLVSSVFGAGQEMGLAPGGLTWGALSIGFCLLVLGLSWIVRDHANGQQSVDTDLDNAEHGGLADAGAITAALESLSDAVAVFDSDERLVYCNSKYTELTPESAAFHVPGTTMEQLLRARLEKGVYFQAIGREEEWLAENLHEFRTGAMAREQELKDGRWVSVRYRRTDDGRIVGVRTDISKRKLAEQKLRESESRFRDIAEITSDWLWEMDADLRFRTCIGRGYHKAGFSFKDTEGMTRREIAVFRNWIIDPEVMRLHMDDIENHRPFYDFEYTLETKSGAKIICYSSGIPYFDEDGEFMGYRGSSRDVTLLKSTEDELRNLQKMKAMGKLTGGVAHEFNNILAVVMGNLELLEGKVSDDALLVKMINSAMTASKRGARLTSQLQSFSHTQPLRPDKTDLGELVGGMRGLIASTVGGRIRVKPMIGPSLSDVTVDTSQMQEVCLALAVNAAEAMPDGGELTINVWNADVGSLTDLPVSGFEPEHCVALSFQDTGVGMTPDVMDSAVDPFFTTKGLATNSGLGLSMVHGFVAQSGGTLTLTSKPGSGSTVTLYFPACPRNEFAVEPAGGKLILVVEDDLPVRNTVVGMLTELGYRTLEASDGNEALSLLEKNPDLDLLFTDMVLPSGLSGMEIASEARKRTPDIRILFTSGYSESYLDTPGTGHGKDQILRKPYRRQEMANIVESALN